MLLLALAFLQQVPSARLDKATASPTEPFTVVTGLTELPDGQLLVADASEHRLVLLNPTTSVVQVLSRRGAGPREFRSIGALYQRPGGGAWLSDWALKRLLPINPDGSLEDVIAVPPSLILFTVDGRGRLYADILGRFINGKTTDSVSLVRWVPPAGHVDTIMQVNQNWSTRIVIGGAPRPAFLSLDAQAVLPNGDVVALEAATYRVNTWRDGKRISSSVIPWKPIPITNDEKQAFVDARAKVKPMRMVGGKPAGAPPVIPPRWKESGWVFPAFKPPFEDDGVHAAPDGRIWVRLTTVHTDTVPRYDVIDAAGRLVGRVLLPPGATIAGFGKGTVYLSEKNEDDEIRLRQYSLPRF